MRCAIACLSVLVCVYPTWSAAQPGPDAEPAPEVEPDAEPADDLSGANAQPARLDVPGEIIEVVGTRSAEAVAREHRAVSIVGRDTLSDRAPRTAPEALVYAPGVSVQKTNHGGGSPFVRGVTGQQTLFLIDGFRLNTSIMRSGPNQYFHTVDPAAIERIEVLRGAGSVLYGSDAIGGVIAVDTVDPLGHGHRAQVTGRTASHEQSFGGGASYDGQIGPARVRAGARGASYGDLIGAGSPAGAVEPFYRGDEQRFTGYDELSAHAKTSTPAGRGTLTAAGFGYRQLDAPRTDKCVPEPFECRYFDEQFYDLGYVKYTASYDRVRELELGVALSRTHERRRRVRTERDLILRERDVVWTGGLIGRASTPTWRFGDGGAARVSYGFDVYADALASDGESEAISTGQVTADVRGKYLDGSRYLSGAAFGFGELALDDDVSFTAGVRLTGVVADVEADPEGATGAFTQTEALPVFSAGARVRLAEPLFVVAGVNQGFRAPNLDDLTARSDEGPGFQLANPDLDAETSVTLETGLQVRHERLLASGFVYTTFIDDFIGRTMTTCPPELAGACGDAENVFTLVNAQSATLRGVELAARASLPEGLSVFATMTYTEGDKRVSPDPGDPREALPKLPPLHGVAIVRMDRGVWFAETVGRWALAQDDLAPSDVTDDRIPPGGTPGYGIVDVRVGARVAHRIFASIAVENVTDTRWRVHGSGVDGAGFGVVAAVTGLLGEH